MIPHSQPWLNDSDLRAVHKVFQSGMIANGSLVVKFETNLTNYLGAADTITCGSGTAALMLALLALGIGQGDEVIMPTYVCHSVADAVRSIGAIPVLCDIGEYWVMTDETVRPHVTKYTKAIIVVHIFGILVNTKSLLSFGINIIEDFCQAFGAKYDENSFPILGKMAIFSFHATKCLTTGEGGAVTSKDLDLMCKVRSVVNQKRVPSILTDFQAALGICQLERYEEGLRLRRHIADIYLAKLPQNLIYKMKDIYNRSSYFRFLLTKVDNMNFEIIQNIFAQKGITVRRGVDSLIHRRYGLSDFGFSGAVKCFNETISIPINPCLSKMQIVEILKGVNSFESD